MKRYLTDTHPLIWASSKDPQLSVEARAASAETDRGQAIIIIPPMVAVEMIYAATTKAVGCALLTRNGDITASGVVPVIW